MRHPVITYELLMKRRSRLNFKRFKRLQANDESLGDVMPFLKQWIKGGYMNMKAWS